MSSLSGFKYREITKKLKKLGFALDRQAAGSNEVWYNPNKNLYTTIPKHTGDMPEGTLRAILNQAHIEVQDFLKY